MASETVSEYLEAAVPVKWLLSLLPVRNVNAVVWVTLQSGTHEGSGIVEVSC